MSNQAQNNRQKKTITPREISFPKGGGAVKGIANSFQPDSFTGTAGFSVPFTVTPARGLEPDLSINYSSGGGNGVFGLGFSLSLPEISINTDKGIPRYEDKDIYTLSGAGELTRNILQSLNQQQFEVVNYLPRVESQFALIERWTDTKSGESFWKVTSPNNTTSYFGRTAKSRITNPSNPLQVYKWLIDETIDAKGNRIVYAYKEENNQNVPVTVDCVNRNFTANRYIETIQYGNFIDEDAVEKFAFEIIFDYGEYDLSDPSHAYEPVRTWPCRHDPFSFYNSGFEIRTCRLCHNILLFHHFKKELGDPCLVRSMNLTHNSKQNYSGVQVQRMSLLTEVLVKGYRKKVDNSFEEKVMPVLALRYSSFDAPTYPEYKQLQMGDGTIPGYLDQSGFIPVDLFGEGLPGFLFNDDNTTLYIRPEGNGQYSMPDAPAHFPLNNDLHQGDVSLMDLDGNCELELVVTDPDKAGFYQSHMDGTWEKFQSFISYPTNITDPQIEYADIDADGKLDMLVPGTQSILVYKSDGKKGYHGAVKVLNLTGFPGIQESNQHEYVAFADMFGDGLSHRLRIRNGCVECWPCLGYGSFGEKITFDRSPVFGKEFNKDCLFLADIDGSGFTDLAYISNGWLQIYFNQNGNSFSDPVCIRLPDTYTELDRITFADITGDGTSCLVFTKMEPTPAHYYYNFNTAPSNPGSLTPDTVKPYLLIEADNNTGTIYRVNYSSSTRFYIEDKRRGRPWKTKLPFPVQLVASLSVIEKLTGSEFINKFKYHDGYYDPYERTFCGFGFVESWDSSSYEEFIFNPQNPDFPVNRINSELFVPPVYTKTWYHTGAPPSNNTVSQQYNTEYFHNDSAAYELPDSYLQPEIYDLGIDVIRQAYFALKGQQIRQEVYADDQSHLAENPYTVNESNTEVLLLQPPITVSGHAVFFVTPRETISYNYDRNINDPVIQQAFILDVDLQSGKPTRTCNINLPRRQPVLLPVNIYPEQLTLKATAQVNCFINDSTKGSYWRGIPCEEKLFEIFNLNPQNEPYLSFDKVKKQVDSALQLIVPYQGNIAPNKLQARQFSWTCRFFWDPNGIDCKSYLPLGNIDPQGLLHHEENACFTKDVIQQSFPSIFTDEIIEKEAGYYFDTATGYWWNKGLVQYYYTANEPGKYYQPYKTENCFSGATPSLFSQSVVDYDVPYYLLPVKSYQFVDSSVSLINVYTVDYQALQYKQAVDINSNVSQVLFDPLGQVIVSTLFGKENGQPTGGMRLYEYDGQPAEYVWQAGTFEEIVKDPKKYLQGAVTYFYYNLLAWTEGLKLNTLQPINTITLKREDYYLNGQNSGANGYQLLLTYMNGLGWTLESKLYATLLSPDVRTSKTVQEKWLTTGRVVYNNKGLPCEEYFPLYDDTPYYETQDQYVNRPDVQPPKLTHYDPLSRVIRIDTPKGFFTKTEYSPWETKYFDEDDMVIDSDYYKDFKKNYPKPPIEPTQAQKDELDALEKAVVFYETPVITVRDNMGYTIRTIQTLPERSLPTTQVNDIQGRVVMLIDPRLNQLNEKDGTYWYNTQFRYMMDTENPFYTDSNDAGTQLHFNNIFGSQLWSYSARDYCQFIRYDGLQRQIQLLVKKIDPAGPVIPLNQYNIAEEIIYGEFTANPGLHNLAGEIYQVNDLSGTCINKEYSMLGSVLQYTQQLVKEYKKAVDWREQPVQMDGSPYAFSNIYNALDQLLCETKPDSSSVWYQFNPLGLQRKNWVSFSVTDTQAIVDTIEYEPTLQRQSITYSNGVITTYTYEPSTQRLIELFSKRPGPNKKKTILDTTLQNITYSYDPVGNITRTWDYSFETVFNKNQKVDPLADYTYDAIYRLTKANGRKHPGINGGTYRNNTKDKSFKQSKFSQLPDVNDDKLENYKESYTYDDSGNLLTKQHSALTSSFTADTVPFEHSNGLKQVRITGIPDSEPGYDKSGNPETIYINDAVPLVFNCCENLVKAGIIQRPGEPDDAEYYLYNITDTRVRKLRERLIQASNTEITQMIYLNNFQVKTISTVSKSGSHRNVTPQLERNTLRVMTGDSCVAIIHSWPTDTNKRETKSTNQRSIRFQMGNNLGSVSLEVDASAMLISYEEYFPYGGTAIIAGNSQQEVDLKDYRYAGKECDDSTGFYYYGARYYVPWLGRWLNPDPAGIIDGLNLYAFVGGNPICYTDPSGFSKRAIFHNTQGAGRETFQKKRRVAHDVHDDDVYVGAEIMRTFKPPPGPLENHDIISSLGKVKPAQSMNYLVPRGSRLLTDLVPPADILAVFKDAATTPLEKPIPDSVSTIAGIHGSNARKSSMRLPVEVPMQADNVRRTFIHSRSAGGNERAIAAVVATAFAIRDLNPLQPMMLAGDINQDPDEIARVIAALPGGRAGQLRVLATPYSTHITRKADGDHTERTIDFVITNIRQQDIELTASIASRRSGNPDHGRLNITIKKNPVII